MLVLVHVHVHVHVLVLDPRIDDDSGRMCQIVYVYEQEDGRNTSTTGPSTTVPITSALPSRFSRFLATGHSARCRSSMSYRDDLSALQSRVDSLRSELAEAEHLAIEARRLVRQHVIEAELATPCTALWAEMKGDDRVRHCDRCNKHVYYFAELTRDEIDAAIVKTEGKLCSRLFVRADGTIMTKDCKQSLAAMWQAESLRVEPTVVNAVEVPEPEARAYMGESHLYQSDVSISSEPRDH